MSYGCSKCGGRIEGKIIEGKITEDRLCRKCKTIKEDTKLRRDLLTAFGGKGRRGFLQYLKLGKFLEQCETPEDITLYNDRLRMIQGLVGSREALQVLLAKFAENVIEIAAQGNEGEIEPGA